MSSTGTTDPPRKQDKTTLDRVLVCLLLAPVIAFGVCSYGTTTPAPPTSARVAQGEHEGLRIDPNTAQWWELTVLPGIGEVTAKRITDYRESRRRELGAADDAIIFRSAADLQQVKGIGPKKSDQAAPYLSFAHNTNE